MSHWYFSYSPYRPVKGSLLTVTNIPAARLLVCQQAVVDRIQSYLTVCAAGEPKIGHSAKLAVPLFEYGDHLTGCCKVRNCVESLRSLIECRSTTQEPVPRRTFPEF